MFSVIAREGLGRGLAFRGNVVIWLEGFGGCLVLMRIILVIG